ncbi:MAG: transglutaminase domain-containing protein [Chitinophagaceae bacterium]|nr:transglutaminase domain-containing protein [Chitinophagaceae bacterium]
MTVHPFYRLLLIFIFLSLSTTAQYINPEDEATALQLSKKYKDEAIACISSYQFFSFDKGKNALNDKVVTIQEEAVTEFLAIKKFGSMLYPEFYNRFIQIKNFTRAVKYGGRYINTGTRPIDRSVTDDGIFFDDSRVQYYPIRFTERGAMNKIIVKKEYSDAKYLTRLFFHERYPVKEKTFEFKVPDWLLIDFKPINFDGNKIEKRVTTKGGYTNYLFVMRDIPAIKEEPKSIGIAFTEPHIIIQVKSFETKGEAIKGFDKVDDVYGWNYRLYQMAANEPDQLKAVVAKVTQGKQADAEKVKAIYYWVQDNVKYIAYEDGYSGYIPSSAQEVLNKKYGDCKGMANLLTEMLMLAGFDARFTWIGTRDIPYSQTMPALCVNNHAITTLYFGGKEYFLDATEKYIPFGENAYRIQGKEAMIANKEKFELKTVPLTTGEEHKIKTTADFSLVDNILTGKLKILFTGNERTDFHQTYQQLPVTSQKEFLENLLEFGNSNITSKISKTSDLQNRELPVVVEGESNLSNNVSIIDGDYYVNIDFFPKTLQGYLPDEKRTRGYDLNWVTAFEDELSLTIPANKKFTDVPEKLELNTESYSFSGEYIVAGNKIVLKKKLLIRKSTISKKDFAAWSQFLESIKAFSENYITVTSK